MVAGVNRTERIRPPRRRELTEATSRCGSPATPNAALVARCINGEFGAWNELVTRYERLVYAIPLREGLSADDAAEISQAAFETLVQSLDRIREPERLGHWLMTVTRRLTWRRRSMARSEVSLDVDDLELQPVSADAEWTRAVDVYDAIVELGDPCRSLIFGLFFDPAEPSYGDLAQLLGMAVGSIGPLRGRCLDRLRDALDEGDR